MPKFANSGCGQLTAALHNRRNKNPSTVGHISTEGHPAASGEMSPQVLGECPHVTFSAGSSAPFTYLIRFYGFRQCKLVAF